MPKLTRSLTLLAAVLAAAIAMQAQARATTIAFSPRLGTDPYFLLPVPGDGVAVFLKVGPIFRIGPTLQVTATGLNGLDASLYPNYAVDAGGVIWGAGHVEPKPIVRIDTNNVSTLTSTEPLPSGGLPYRVAFGSDGRLWFSVWNGPGLGFRDTIGARNPDGSITEFNGVTPGAHPSTLLLGPDGNLWFPEPGTNTIGRITPTGAVTEFLLPAGMWLYGDLAFGPGGDLYITVAGGLARMTTAGAVVGGVIDGGLTDFAPDSLAFGGDGNLWATECSANTVARISPGGVVTRAPRGTFPGQACPSGMVAAKDGTLWLFEYNLGRVGHVIFDAPVATTDDATDLAPTAAALNGEATPRGSATTVHFEYGTTTSYGQRTPDQAIADGDDPVAVSALRADLHPATTYHYRLVARSVIGTAHGSDQTVTTPAIPPPPPPPLPVDHDGDGFTVTHDCDDLSAAIHPGALDKPGDRIDQDCSGADAAYLRFQPHADAGWKTVRGRIIFTRMLIDAMPTGSSLTLTCTGGGCMKRGYSATLAKPVKRLDLIKRLKGARLRKGAKIELTLSRPGYITTIVRWTIGPPPRVTILCQPPGAKKASPC